MGYPDATQAGQVTRGPAVEVEQRAISAAMSNLAAQVGDLRTVAMQLAHRISPLIPGGSPWDQPQKALLGNVANTPTPVRSHHCEEIETRTTDLRALTDDLQKILHSIEI